MSKAVSLQNQCIPVGTLQVYGISKSEHLPLDCQCNSMYDNIVTKQYNFQQYATILTISTKFHKLICKYNKNLQINLQVTKWLQYSSCTTVCMIVIDCQSILFDFGYNIVQWSIQSCIDILVQNDWPIILYNIVHLDLSIIKMICVNIV